jgi:hypothetical protein
MCNQLCIGISNFQFRDLFLAEYLVHHAGPIPKQHIPSRDFVDVSAKIFIGSKDDWLVFGKTFNDVFRIAACADHIAQRLYPRAAVDLAHYHVIGMLLFELFKQGRRTAIAQRTSGFQVRDHDFLSGV